MWKCYHILSLILWVEGWKATNCLLMCSQVVSCSHKALFDIWIIRQLRHYILRGEVQQTHTPNCVRFFLNRDWRTTLPLEQPQVKAQCFFNIILHMLFGLNILNRFDEQSKSAFIGDYSGQISVIKVKENSFEHIVTLKGHAGESLGYDST